MAAIYQYDDCCRFWWNKNHKHKAMMKLAAVGIISNFIGATKAVALDPFTAEEEEVEVVGVLGGLVVDRPELRIELQSGREAFARRLAGGGPHRPVFEPARWRPDRPLAALDPGRARFPGTE